MKRRMQNSIQLILDFYGKPLNSSMVIHPANIITTEWPFEFIATLIIKNLLQAES
jgi:hypothetical protein